MNMYTKTGLSPAAEPASFFSGTKNQASMKKTSKAVQAYAKVEEQKVASTTSATELMTMLFDKACVLLTKAIQAFETQDDQTFHQSTLHALQIVLSLRFVLDTDSDNTLSQGLFATYTAIAASLKKAKDEKDVESIATIYSAMDELRTAWHSIS